jgi:hypothetical protein
LFFILKLIQGEIVITLRLIGSDIFIIGPKEALAGDVPEEFIALAINVYWPLAIPVNLVVVVAEVFVNKITFDEFRILTE